MPIDRRAQPGENHLHKCPDCERNFNCSCRANSDKESLQCRECEETPGWFEKKEQA